MNVTINIDDEKLTRALRELQSVTSDLTPVMDDLADKLMYAVEENFATEGARLGTPWKPSLRAMIQGGQTMQDTGLLAESISKSVTPNSAEVGTNVLYGPIHQFGGTIHAKNAPYLKFRTADGRFHSVKSVEMPARPFLGVNDEDRSDLLEIVAAHLASAFR